MAWIVPNLSWLPTDKINFADWNRIENNIRECALYLNSIGYILPSFPVNPYSLSLDGVNDYVDCGSNASMSLANSDFTVETWVNRTSQVGTFDCVISQGDIAGGTDKAFHIGFRNTNVFTFGFWADDLDTIQSFPINDGWHHWAVTFSDSTLTKTIYRDGQFVQSGVAASHFIGAANTFISRLAGANLFNGLVDDVRIWKGVVKTQAQIASNMNRQLIGNEAGLVAYWKINEGSGLTAFDSTSNHNDGTLTSGPTWTQGSQWGNDHLIVNRDITSLDKLSSINRIEQALEYIRINFVTPSGYLGTRVWDVSSTFDNTDAIRLETDVKMLYDLGALVFQSFVYCGTQNSGTQELIW